jgi:hypothetical protein
MVNTTIVSRFTDDLPVGDTDADLKIEGDALYDRAEVLELLKGDSSQSVVPWTKKCIHDLQNYDMNNEDAARLLERCMLEGSFLGAMWCRQRPDGPWAACDAYRVSFSEWNQAAHKNFLVKYYVKYAIGRSGKVLLVVSCHPSEERR